MNLVNFNPKFYILAAAIAILCFFIWFKKDIIKPSVDLQTTEIWFFANSSAQSISLPSPMLFHAKKAFNKLSDRFNPTLFNTHLLKNSSKIRSLTTKRNKLLPKCITCGRLGSIKVNNDLNIPYTYFDRGSDTLLVIGGGLANDRERMAPFVALFPQYDLVLFDYRGHGIEQTPTTLKGKLSKQFLGIDCTETTLCEKEDEEVTNLIKYFKQNKPYTSIFGIGLCYSAVILAKVAAKNPGTTFDKLMLDGAWPNLSQIGEKFSSDPMLFFDPQRGSRIGRFFGRFSIIKSFVQKTWEKLFSIKFKDGINALSYFEKLADIPVLFFQSTNDLLIPMSEFGKVWRSVPHKQKIAIVTPAKHLQNFVKYKETFSMLGHLFFENSYQKFVRLITKKDEFKSEKEKIKYPE